MQQFRESLALQFECCRCLSVVAFGHDRNRIILVADGAVEVTLAARTRFRLETKLLEVTSVLFTNLSHNCGAGRATAECGLVLGSANAPYMYGADQKAIGSESQTPVEWTRFSKRCRRFLVIPASRRRVAGLS